MLLQTQKRIFSREAFFRPKSETQKANGAPNSSSDAPLVQYVLSSPSTSATSKSTSPTETAEATTNDRTVDATMAAATPVPGKTEYPEPISTGSPRRNSREVLLTSKKKRRGKRASEYSKCKKSDNRSQALDL